MSGAARTACDSQWFDYSPGVPRYGIWTRDHKRWSAELSAQFKVNKDLDVWARYNRNNQEQMLNDRNYVADFGSMHRFSPGGVASTISCGLSGSSGKLLYFRAVLCWRSPDATAAAA